ncbi:MAG: porin [Pseudomonas sp.]|uniref:porin n=1 Tax=Pseudomonas abieticivorans TaxID=2931382 RepID=UPI0020BFB647|nr:porin [Pseudomonas sp. PIA16]MDE1166130.1 porin [Pseudomonas sp.]
MKSSSLRTVLRGAAVRHFCLLMGCTALGGAAPAWAIDLINNGTDRLELHAQGIFASNDKVYIQGRHTGSIGHRINMIYGRKLNDDWTLGMRQEWAYDPFYYDGSNAHTKRFQYVFLKSARWGQLNVGQQKSLTFDMVGSITDWYLGYGTKGQGTFNGYGGNQLLGFSRPKRTVYYRVKRGAFELGVMAGGSTGPVHNSVSSASVGSSTFLDSTRDGLYQVGTIWHPSSKWSLRLAYGHTDMTERGVNAQGDITTRHPDAEGWLSGITYTSHPWYHALVYGQYRNLNASAAGASGYQKATALESYSSYSFPEMGELGFFKAYGGINLLSDKTSAGQSGYSVAGFALITLHDHLAIGLERKFDMAKNKAGQATGEDEYELVAKYYF